MAKNDYLIETYRGWTIEYTEQKGYYAWVDYNRYDGPESDCFGTETSVEACREAIDEYIEEHLEMCHCGDDESWHDGGDECRFEDCTCLRFDPVPEDENQ